MNQVGKYLRKYETNREGFGGGYAHWCAACQELHVFATDKPQRNGAHWTFNGDLLRPGFTPSMNIRWGRQADPKCDVDGGVCHYTITAGLVTFHADCTHALKGQTAPLLELPPGYRDA